MNPESLTNQCLTSVLDLISKCDANNKRFQWRMFWRLIGELPSTLKVKLLDSLGRRELIDDDNIGFLINSQIIELNLFNCHKSDYTLEIISKHCHKLRSLNLGARIPNFNLITSEAFIPMFNVCSHLEDIRLSNCINVNDNVVAIIVHSCQHLKVLNLSGCLSITDRSIKLIAMHCKCLNSLDVSKTRVGDDGLFHFAKHGLSAKQINELLINDCSFVSNSSVSQILKACTNLNIFSFNGTRATMESLYDVITRPLRQIQFDVPN